MKLALTALLLCAAAWAQTPAPSAPKAAAKTPAKAAPKAVTKAPAKAPARAAAKAPGMDLLKPETVKGKAPEIFVVRLETTKGNIDIRVVRGWAPNGVAHFYNLVRAGYYDGNYFFRVLDFMAQTGINPRPEVNRVWSERTLFDDRVVQPNKRGMVTFAARGEPNSRSTQFFINKLDENVRLDALKFAPFGEVVEGMDVVDKIYGGYGDTPNQGALQDIGEPYVNRNFPRLDKIIKASIIAVPQP